MKDYQLPATEEELQALLNLLDLAAKAGGLRSTKAAHVWLLKVEGALEKPSREDNGEGKE